MNANTRAQFSGLLLSNFLRLAADDNQELAKLLVTEVARAVDAAVAAAHAEGVAQGRAEAVRAMEEAAEAAIRAAQQQRARDEAADRERAEQSIERCMMWIFDDGHTVH